MDRQREALGHKRARWLGLAAVLMAVLAIVVWTTRSRDLSFARSQMNIETVKRGTLLREVVGKGKLVPEQVHWLTATATARVERILVEPGAMVEPDTVLVELSNPELELHALEAEMQARRTTADNVTNESSLHNQALGVQAGLLDLQHELEDARRRTRADDELAAKGYLSILERDNSRSKVKALEGRLAIEKRKRGQASRALSARVESNEAVGERARSLAQMRQRAVDGLRVRAGIRGIVQELPLQLGQSVAAGGLVAKVAEPGRLRTELRIPEIQAGDLRIEQVARIDTHTGVLAGKVTRVDPTAQNGTVKVEVALDGALPSGLRPDQSVDGTIEIERLPDVIHVTRPANAAPESNALLFKVSGDLAVRTRVRLGRGSVRAVVVEEGLSPGDEVIVSSTAMFVSADRIRLR